MHIRNVMLFRLMRSFEQLSPDYTGIELGIGESLLVKAIGEYTGRSLQLIKADLKKEGDLVLVAMVRSISHTSSRASRRMCSRRTPRTCKRRCSSQGPSLCPSFSRTSKKSHSVPATR